MLLAIPYLAVANIMTILIGNGGPGWFHLLVLLCICNAFKFLVMGPVQEAIFSGQKALGGEHRGVHRAEHAGSVLSAELHRTGRELEWGEAPGRLFGGVGDYGGDGFAVLVGGESPPHRLAGGLGHEVQRRHVERFSPTASRPTCPIRNSTSSARNNSYRSHTRDAPRPLRRITAKESAGAGAPLDG